MSAFKPDVDSTHDLGTSALRWRNLFIDDVEVTNNVTISGNLTVNGGTTQQNVTTIQVKDPIMQLNYEDGSALTGANSGIHVGRNGTTDASLIFDEVSGDVWKAGLAGAEVELLTLSATQTLTNKTLTNPTINAAALSGTLSGTPTFSDVGTHSALDIFNAGITVKNGSTSAGFIELYENSGNGGNKTTLIGAADTSNADVVLTLPVATDTLVGKATTDTLTNKTLSGATLSGTIAGTPTFSGVGTHSALDVFNASLSVKNGETSAGFIEFFEDSGNGSAKITLIGAADVGASDVVLTLPVATDTLVGKATTDTLTNKTLSGATLSGTMAGTPTFSGVGTHSALDVFNAGISVKNGETSAGFIELYEDSSNGTNKATLIGPAATDDVTLTLPAATDTLVGKATTDTLTNKTLTNPSINAAALSGTLSGTPTFSDVVTHSALDIFNAGISVKNGATSAGFIELFENSGNGGNKTTLIGAADTSNADVVLTLPVATDTLVGKATTDTLTNKTLTNPNINAAALSGTLSGTPTFSDNVSFSGSNTFENSTGQIIQGAEAGAGILYIKADQGDDDGDTWKFNVADGGVLTLGNDISSSNVSHLTVTPNATVGNSLARFHGDVTVDGDLIVSGDSVTQNVATVQVEDPIMQINYTSGAAGALQDSGIHVGRTGTTDASLIWDHSISKWAAGLKDAEIALVDISSSQSLTNKTLSGATLSGTMAGTPTFSGVGTHSALDIFNAGISVKNGATSAGFIELYENSGNGGNKTTLIGAADTSNADVVLTLPVATDTLVGKATTDTLTNKTLSGATLSGTMAGTPTFSGVGTHSALDVFNAGISVKNGETSAGFIELYEDGSNGSNKVTLIGPASTADVTLTLPSATDTLVGKTTTDTLTNKTLTNPTINAAALSGTLSGTPTFSDVGTHSALDVFNAGISVKNGETSAGFIELYEDSSNGTNKATLIGPASTDDVTLTLPAATDTLVGLATTDTLTNKTLTSPVINTGTVGTSLVPSSSGAADLGTTSVMWGDIFIADDKAIQFGDAQDAKIEYDENGSDQLRIHAPSAGVVISGTTPTLVIGDAGEEDTKLVFDGAEQDFYMGIDDDDNKLHLGLGSTVGTTANIVLNSANRNIELKGDMLVPDGFSIGVAAQASCISVSNTGVVSIPDDTVSSATNNGALVVTGGVGVGLDLYVGGELHVGHTTGSSIIGASNTDGFVFDMTNDNLNLSGKGLTVQQAAGGDNTFTVAAASGNTVVHGTFTAGNSDGSHTHTLNGVVKLKHKLQLDDEDKSLTDSGGTGSLAATHAYMILASASSTSDDLHQITGGIRGQIIVLQAESGHTITIHDNEDSSSTDKILLNGADDVVLNSPGDSLQLIYRASVGWVEIGRSIRS